jgi:hypothetical protein
MGSVVTINERSASLEDASAHEEFKAVKIMWELHDSDTPNGDGKIVEVNVSSRREAIAEARRRGSAFVHELELPVDADGEEIETEESPRETIFRVMG